MTTAVDTRKYLSKEQIEARLDWIKASPADTGAWAGQ